jgi:hypothetical protein
VAPSMAASSRNCWSGAPAARSRAALLMSCADMRAGLIRQIQRCRRWLGRLRSWRWNCLLRCSCCRAPHCKHAGSTKVRPLALLKCCALPEGTGRALEAHLQAAQLQSVVWHVLLLICGFHLDKGRQVRRQRGPRCILCCVCQHLRMVVQQASGTSCTEIGSADKRATTGASHHKDKSTGMGICNQSAP